MLWSHMLLLIRYNHVSFCFHWLQYSAICNVINFQVNQQDLFCNKIVWGSYLRGGWSKMSAYLPAGNRITKANFLFYWRHLYFLLFYFSILLISIVSMLKIADVLGRIGLEAISKPWYSSKYMEKASHLWWCRKLGIWNFYISIS